MELAPRRVDSHSKPVARTDLDSVELDGEVVMYDEDTGTLHHLNPSATAVFKLCDGQTTTDDMCHDIAVAYEQSIEVIRPHVEALLVQLDDSGLLIDLTETEEST